MDNNFYVGSYEYAIVYRNGQFHVIDVLNTELFNAPPIFSGLLVECDEFIRSMYLKYEESLF